jgi:hypothetical protein
MKPKAICSLFLKYDKKPQINCTFAISNKSIVFVMCTVSINIDEAAVRRINPLLTSRESISQWLQRQVDEMIEEMAFQAHSKSPNAHTAKEMKTIVAERVRLMESGEATYIDGEEGFAQIRARYGL